MLVFGNVYHHKAFDLIKWLLFLYHQSGSGQHATKDPNMTQPEVLQVPEAAEGMKGFHALWLPGNVFGSNLFMAC